MKKIAIITSGGDVPGLNAAIRAAARTALGHGVEVLGVRDGYDGLIGGRFVPIDARTVSNTINKGGTWLGTARSSQFEEQPAARAQCVDNLRSAGVDGLIVIGGNGTLKGAHLLNLLGMPVVGVPKTIDNDQLGTDMSIGVDTALNTIIEAIDKIKDTAASHHRAFLVEVMGRRCGYLALAGAIACGAELALIPEQVCSPEQVARTIAGAYERGKTHCIILVAEGWKPGVRSLLDYFRGNDIVEGFDVREVVLGHVQRGGKPSAFDRLLATRLGAAAAEALITGTGDGMMAGLHGSDIGLTPLATCTLQDRPLNADLIKLGPMLAR